MSALTIERIAAGGDGVGHLADGMTVFVPRTAPDDHVDVEVVQRKARYARGRVRAIERPGASRIVPECPHFVKDACGGCQLQHLRPEAQRAAKQRIVGEALRRIGKRDVPDPDIVAAPRPWRYRTRISLSVSPRTGAIGYHRHDQPGTIFELEDCRLARESLARLWRELRDHRGLFPPGTETLVLREDTDGGLHVVLQGGSGPFDPVPLVQAAGIEGLHMWWQPSGGAARVVAGPRTGFPATAFAQVHPEVADLVRAAAVAAVRPAPGKVLWDLYAGTGETARALAARGAVVWGVEVDRAAVRWAERQPPVHHAPPDSPAYVRGRVEESLHRLPTPDAMVMNPPRHGLHRRVTQALEQWAPTRPGSRAAYISCDAATLARDLARLPSFEVVAVQAYDLFPQTAHVETLAVLEVSCATA